MRGALDPADELEAEMVAYYAARAPEYDEWYLRSDRYVHTEIADGAWKADLDRAARWLDGIPMAGEIVELAAGTGWWSPHLARKGRLSVCDISPEMLELARSRLGGLRLAVRFELRDAWTEPDRQVSGLFTGFWLSHVSRERLPDFLSLANRWLKPGGVFAFMDSRRDHASGAVDHQPPADDVQLRRLNDGRTFRVRKVYYSPSELEAALLSAGFVDAKVETSDRFFLLGHARRG
jgi:demethylmenaquinone methyltransferase/2-methoxy-6-polyprenyl-1,4-benzoquinol methylase